VTDPSAEALSNLMHENRRFPPSPEFEEETRGLAALRAGLDGLTTKDQVVIHPQLGLASGKAVIIAPETP